MAEVTQAEPVAWLHTMTYETGDTRVRLTETDCVDPDYPDRTAFGRPGRDYSAEFTVTSEPLYTARHRTEVVKPLVEALENKDGLAEAIHNARFNGPVTTTWADECESGKLYCHRIANAVELHMLAALRSVQS